MTFPPLDEEEDILEDDFDDLDLEDEDEDDGLMGMDHFPEEDDWDDDGGPDLAA